MLYNVLIFFLSALFIFNINQLLERHPKCLDSFVLYVYTSQCFLYNIPSFSLILFDEPVIFKHSPSSSREFLSNYMMWQGVCLYYLLILVIRNEGSTNKRRKMEILKETTKVTNQSSRLTIKDDQTIFIFSVLQLVKLCMICQGFIYLD